MPDPQRLNRAASSSQFLSPWTYHAICSTGAYRQHTTSCQCSPSRSAMQLPQRQGLLANPTQRHELRLTIAQTLCTRYTSNQDINIHLHDCSRLVSDGEGRRNAGSRVCCAHSAAVAAERQQLGACRVPGDRRHLVSQALSRHSTTA